MKLKLSSDLYVGIAELRFLRDSIESLGWKRFAEQMVVTYGVVRNPSDPSFTSLQVFESGVNQLGIRAGVAIDTNFDAIELKTDLINHITVPQDNTTRFVVAKYASSIIEEGEVDIQADGTITGVDTKFTERLRGLPDVPSVIKFISTNNSQEYIVQSVQSDTIASLNAPAGQLAPETQVKYQVVGTFTPGVVVPSGNKFPFENDSYEIDLRTNGAVVAGEEFILAEVVNNSTSISIFDKRQASIFSIFDTESNEISKTNKVIGLESIKYDSLRSGQSHNLVQIGWGLEAQDGQWSVDASNQKISLSLLSGGAWLNPSPFNEGDLDGWYVTFLETSEEVRVESSVKNGASIELNLDFLTNYPSSGNIYITPSCDHVEIDITSASNTTSNQRLTFAPGSRFAIIKLEAGVESKIRFRHLSEDQSSIFELINNGQYINENSYDTSGALASENRTPYNNGCVRPMLSLRNMYDFLIPCGLIAGWYNGIDTVPMGWVICDGQNGTPDFRDKFIIGYNPDTDTVNDPHPPGETGGSFTKTLLEANLPPHEHEGVTDEDGLHSHPLTGTNKSVNATQSNVFGGSGDIIATDTGGGDQEGAGNTSMGGLHDHNFTTDDGKGTSEPFDITPPFYRLIWIMKELCEAPLTPNGAVGNLIDVSNLNEYFSDFYAGQGGVAIGQLYKLAKKNAYADTHGTLKCRES